MDGETDANARGPQTLGGAPAKPSLKVPGYRLEKRIGQGGMAAVYLAIQESLDRPLALKVLNAVHSDDPRYALRFVDEGRIIAALNHRNIITIHDVGAVDGLLYIAMEYVEGGDLTIRMGKPFPVEEALALVRTLGEALAFAHRAGVAHRDVKPANVLFRGDGTVLLTDFGIAKRLESETTVGATVLGTPGYLSPEQANGGKVDGRTDIYSLGVILYEMLVGKRPYEGDTPIATILKQLQEPIPDLPSPLGRLQPLLDRMIAREPDQRFPDMDALLAAIDAVSAREARRARRRGGRRLLATGLAALAAASAVALAVHPALAPVRDRAVSLVSDLAVQTLAEPPAHVAAPARKPPVATATAAAPAPDPAVARLLELVALGQQSLTDGRLTRPRGENALAYFREALEIDPSNPAARAGIDEITSRYAAMAQRSLSERDFLVAKRHAEQGLAVQPDHPGLVAVSREAEQSLARIQRLLAAGDQALYQKRLTTPKGNNALHYYDAVLRIQPGNGRAVDGKARIVRRYAELAEDRIEHYQYADARELIRRGLEVEPGNRRLLSLRRRAQPDQAPRQLIRDIKGLFD